MVLMQKPYSKPKMTITNVGDCPKEIKSLITIPNSFASQMVSNSLLSTKLKEYLIDLLFDDRSNEMELIVNPILFWQ